MIHPETELLVVRSEVGLGVYARSDIPRGTLLWVRDPVDQVLEAHEVAALPSGLRSQVERLSYQDARGRTIVCWDGGKHVNHSCSPTMRGVGHDAMIAVVDVGVGDELTCDYAECNLESPLACLCGSAECRGTIGGELEASLWELWQAEVARAVQAAAGRPQPLLDACVDPLVADVLAGRAEVPRLRAVAKS